MNPKIPRPDLHLHLPIKWSSEMRKPKPSVRQRADSMLDNDHEAVDLALEILRQAKARGWYDGSP